MRRDRYHKELKKEKIVMGASACLVLAALTMTGIYVKNSGVDERDDGYKMDYETLDSSKEEIESLFPTFPSEEADTPIIGFPSLTREDEELLADEAAMAEDAMLSEIEDTTGNDTVEIETEQESVVTRESVPEDIVVVQEDAPEEVQEGIAKDVLVQGEAEEIPTVEASSFAMGEALSWPISGNVLISFSMDSTVYFATLEQYKYNPGMVMEAKVGDEITSVAAGTVVEVAEDPEIGKYVKVDIGNGYTTIYGQLQNISAYVGGTVDVGSVLGYVAEPTKYYSVEGANAYFALTKNGEPVDPLAPLW